MKCVTPCVSLHMLDHMIFANESLVANLAHEWFLTSVKTHVPAQIRLVVELLGTQWTLVRFVASVLLLVLVKQFRVRESLAAHVALERFVTFVESVVMLRQVANTIERFVTLGAFEATHSCRTAAG